MIPTESRNELQELTAEICETVDWPEFHRVDATQSEQVRAILERFMAKHYQYEDALVAAIPKAMQATEAEAYALAAAPQNAEPPFPPELLTEIQADCSKEYGNPLGMYVKHEGTWYCSACGMLAHEEYSGQLCYHCGIRRQTLELIAEIKRLQGAAAPAAPLPQNETRWVILFDDADVGPEIFSGAGAEEAAKTRFAHCSENWSCYLFQEVAAASAPLRPESNDVPK